MCTTRDGARARLRGANNTIYTVSHPAPATVFHCRALLCRRITDLETTLAADRAVARADSEQRAALERELAELRDALADLQVPPVHHY